MRLFPILAAALALVPACAPLPATAPAPAATAATETRTPITLLVSIDGFRADYLDRGITPNLSRLAAEGASAAMRPSFPSKTFPNHWTLVTGLRPDRHGIVANRMEDPARPGEVFTMATEDPFWWNAADPIWVEAERAGIRTATEFWPGASVAIGGTKAENGWTIEGGTRPSDWHAFNQAVDNVQRVNAVLDWMRRPAAIRPRFVTLYFDTVDTAGHMQGPDGPETRKAIAEVDARIGDLTAGLAALGQPVNLVIVADHGMAATSAARTILLSDILPASDYVLAEAGTYATLTPVAGREAAVAAALLRPHPHLECWRKEAMPARFHYGTNRRVPPFFCLAETGWQVLPKAPPAGQSGGNHGYDPAAPEMAALFVAHGPAFRAARLAPFDNVAVYPLLRDLLDLPAKPGMDGDDAPFRGVLRR